MNVAVTDSLALIVSWQVGDVPEQAPDQPAKEEPAEAAAVKVIWVPVATETEQVEPQEMPPPLTVPAPVPDLLTLREANDGPPLWPVISGCG